jgi:hypothetical protein
MTSAKRDAGKCAGAGAKNHGLGTWQASGQQGRDLQSPCSKQVITGIIGVNLWLRSRGPLIYHLIGASGVEFRASSMQNE